MLQVQPLPMRNQWYFDHDAHTFKLTAIESAYQHTLFTHIILPLKPDRIR